MIGIIIIGLVSVVGLLLFIMRLFWIIWDLQYDNKVLERENVVMSSQLHYMYNTYFSDAKSLESMVDMASNIIDSKNNWYNYMMYKSHKDIVGNV